MYSALLIKTNLILISFQALVYLSITVAYNHPGGNNHMFSFEGNETILLLIPATVIQDLLLFLRSNKNWHYTLLNQNVNTTYIVYRLYGNY